MLFRKIFNFLVDRGPTGSCLAGAFYIFALMIRLLITTFLGLLGGVALTSWTNNPGLIVVAASIGVFVSYYLSFSIDVGGPLGFLSYDALLTDPKDAAEVKAAQARREMEPEKYNELPHFGKLLQKDQVMDIIERYNFAPYETRSGMILSNVAVSEDDKWICILGGYMPVDLICGYNKDKNELYTIDGAIIRLPLKARTYHIRSEIEAFFEDRGNYYMLKPRKADEKFMEAFERPCSVLDKADFSRLRYRWEKANAADKSTYGRDHERGSKYKPVLKGYMVNDAIFRRVLSGSEVAKTANAIKNGQADLSEYLNFNRYFNEFSVCNGVELLYSLRYPDNKDGLDFLFKCLCDVDEAYFGPAVDVLLDFPKDELKRKIEEQTKLVFESGDVVALGGVMFLAQRINYEIKYLEKAKAEHQEAEQQALAAAKELEEKASKEKSKASDPNAVPEFEFDELTAFGSEEVQGFAYQKQ